MIGHRPVKSGHRGIVLSDAALVANIRSVHAYEEAGAITVTVLPNSDPKVVALYKKEPPPRPKRKPKPKPVAKSQPAPEPKLEPSPPTASGIEVDPLPPMSEEKVSAAHVEEAPKPGLVKATPKKRAPRKRSVRSKKKPAGN